MTALSSANIVESSAKAKTTKAVANTILSTPQAVGLGIYAHDHLFYSIRNYLVGPRPKFINDFDRAQRFAWAETSGYCKKCDLANRAATTISIAGTLTLILLPILLRTAEHQAEIKNRPILAKCLGSLNAGLAIVNKVILSALSVFGLMVALTYNSPLFTLAYGSFALLNTAIALHEIACRISLITRHEA